VKIGPAVERLHEAELDLADRFRELGERHPSEHDVYHHAHTFAKECLAHAEQLEPIAERYGKDVETDEEAEGGIIEALRRTTGAILGRRPESGLLLLRDLRELYVAAQSTLIAWIIVHQGAMAARDKELLDVAKRSQSETDLQMKWLLTRIKITAPQVLTS
jgi:hypothetical protein